MTAGGHKQGIGTESFETISTPATKSAFMLFHRYDGNAPHRQSFVVHTIP
ncbi:hypothetical protein SAMN05445871_5485 [Paraburkholderia caballeronis]|uniref:Uncharacterized protein n=1 Tax=Paraburkholderia caballeronis TaxID=416943 RepID=A0A1H7RPU3_9BURK|nr:hypothetical protein C7403_111111 [Paraburkholderia caballeronis]PXW97793.1 hypothetical protein C7407_111111 [Paraburkholderia caballeronis]RAJ94763.1 hypothetical protein C7409_111111 [Paraburkholderia caballeronis]SEE61438.1 hypothetical protein SAMN05445871_5485 [Paraburkholderia caballeronis]SEL61844.1 hypothetical protein SAMN05192542_110111 [Paraburkholderia caballeronis]